MSVAAGIPQEPAASEDPSPHAGIRRWRWAMISLVFLATVINYLDRQTLSVVAPTLMREFQMTNVTYSRIVFAFMLAYTVMNGVSGPMIDRMGTRLGYSVCVAWWSTAAVLHVFATGAWSLGIVRFLLGMGEAGNWPAGVRVVAEWFPVRERALASGIFNSGSSIGALIAAPLVAWLSLSFGWRSAFAAVGATGFVWLILWRMIYRTPPDQSATAGEEVRIPTRRLIRDKFVWTFTLSKVFMDPVWYFYIFWFPQYLQNARGFDLAAVGKFAWIPFLTADAGNLLGGTLSGWLIRKGSTAANARKVAIGFFAMLMTAAIPAVLVKDTFAAIALVSIATLGYTGAVANMLALPADIFPKSSVASIWGLASMGSGFGGMVFALLTGWLVDTYSYIPAFAVFGLIPLLSAFLVAKLPSRPGTSISE